MRETSMAELTGLVRRLAHALDHLSPEDQAEFAEATAALGASVVDYLDAVGEPVID